MRNLDQIDHKILEALQHDGRITMTDLAAQIGLSATPCTERVRRLEREGVISGYHARLNPHALGLKLLVFIELRLGSKSPEILESVKQALSRINSIVECHMISGDFDYLVKARLAEMSNYKDLMSTISMSIPAVVQCRSYVAMSELKETHHLCR